MNPTKRQKRITRHTRVRASIGGSALPRVAVFRSNRAISAQIIDDAKKTTMVSIRQGSGKGSKTERAEQAGMSLAKKATEAGIAKVVFDRGGYKYHGRVKAFSEGLRKGGLKF